MIRPHITSGKFTIIKISVKELLQIQTLTLEDTRLSEQDWSAIFYAQQNDALLLSGDTHVQKIGIAKNITVHGMLWILDQLVQDRILSEPDACDFLKNLMTKNKRLPLIVAKKECDYGADKLIKE